MSTKDRKSREKELRREAILDTAEKVFTQKGFEKTTIDDLAHELELAKGTIYLYFKSKEEIYGGIILRGIERMNDLLESELEKAESGLRGFMCVGECFIKHMQKFPIYVNSFARYNSRQFHAFIAENGPMVQEIEKAKRRVVEQTILTLERGKKDGSVKKDLDSKKTAMVSIMLAVGLINMPEIDTKQPDCNREELLEYYFKQMAEAIKAN